MNEEMNAKKLSKEAGESSVIGIEKSNFLSPLKINKKTINHWNFGKKSSLVDV